VHSGGCTPNPRDFTGGIRGVRAESEGVHVECGGLYAESGGVNLESEGVPPRKGDFTGEFAGSAPRQPRCAATVRRNLGDAMRDICN
jgi:hypothetical protein